jgi:YD repeat-containing protein
MKKLNLIIGILIGLTFLSCSSNDSTISNPPASNVKRITKLETSTSAEATQDFTYNENNQITTSQYFEGSIEIFAERFYDSQNRLTSSNSVNQFNQIFQRDYVYDDSGRLIGVNSQREGVVFDDYIITYLSNNSINITGTAN